MIYITETIGCQKKIHKRGPRITRIKKKTGKADFCK